MLKKPEDTEKEARTVLSRLQEVDQKCKEESQKSRGNEKSQKSTAMRLRGGDEIPGFKNRVIFGLFMECNPGKATQRQKEAPFYGRKSGRKPPLLDPARRINAAGPKRGASPAINSSTFALAFFFQFGQDIQVLTNLILRGLHVDLI